MITYTKEDLEKMLYGFACYLTGYNQLDPAFHDNKFSLERRFYGQDWPQNAITMIGVNRLLNIQKLMFDTIQNNVPGDFIETGVWRGGACIFAAMILKMLKQPSRKVYVCDSFAGLPKPDPKYPVDNQDIHHTYNQLIVSLEEVQRNFRVFNLLDDQVKFVKGWFCNTLPTINTTFSIIRLDGDMYSSTIEALDVLYPKLSPGGYAIIDDYCLVGAKSATDDYRRKHNITSPLIEIDNRVRAVYWQKT